MKQSIASPLHAAFKRQDTLIRYIVHLRQRLPQRNLNLLRGAGATHDAGTPLWADLIERIRKDMGKHTAGRVNPLKSFSPAMAAEVLLKWLEARIETDDEIEEIAMWGLKADSTASKEVITKMRSIPDEKKLDYANNRWLNCVRKAVYRNVSPSTPSRMKKHQYLHALGSLVARCPLTINFNFDDVVDAATTQICTENALELPNIVWRLPFGYQSKGSTILHINGFLPFDGKADSNYLVLTEGAFAELMLQKTDYQSISLLRAFAESTMLIVGCSLDDVSLKAILQTSAQINKANVHYIIHFIDEDEHRLKPHFDKIFKANWSIYNLITIFLRREEYGPFLAMIGELDSSAFEVALKEIHSEARSKYLFYIVGAVGSGKTTLIRNLRLFQTHEEWSARPPKQMYRDPSTLTAEEKKQVDTFLKSQLRHKNKLMRTGDVGFHVMDRAFLDLVAFSDNNGENDEKLTMLQTFVRGEDGLQDGVVILLTAKPQELEDSQWMRGQLPKRFGGEGFSLETLDVQQNLLIHIYDTPKEYTFNSRSCDPPTLARTIAYSILTGNYQPINFDNRISDIQGGVLADLYPEPPKGRKKPLSARKRNTGLR